MRCIKSHVKAETRLDNSIVIRRKTFENVSHATRCAHGNRLASVKWSTVLIEQCNNMMPTITAAIVAMMMGTAQFLQNLVAGLFKGLDG
jgi:hypothetical protein